MGCDIHGWVEKKVGEKWIAVSDFNDHARTRNYERFGALANVRCDGPEPRGIPADVSETAKYHIENWDVDGHSHSWMPLAEAVPIFAATAWNPDEFVRKWPTSHFFDVEDDEDLSAYRIVFWFDN